MPAPVQAQLPRLHEPSAPVSDMELPACLQTPSELQVDMPMRLQRQLPSPAAQQMLASVQQKPAHRRDPKQTRPALPNPALVHTRQDPTTHPNHFENRFV